MKRVCSVWMVAVRQILWKLLAVMTVMAAAELVLFRRTMPGLGFGSWLEASGAPLVFGLAFVAVTVILALQGCDFSGGRLRYTLQRLPLSEPGITTLWAMVHVGAYVLLWAVQIAVMLVCWSWYIKDQTGHTAPQMELLVACYGEGRYHFLHGLFPLANGLRWLKTVTGILCLSVGTAHFGFRQRNGKLAFSLAVVAGLHWLTFRLPISDGSVDVMMVLVYLAFLTAYVVQLWRWDHEAD